MSAGTAEKRTRSAPGATAATPTVLVIMNIPTPYRVPLLNELAVQLAQCGFHLKVVFAAAGYAERRWVLDPAEFRFDYVLLPSRRIPGTRDVRVIFTYPGIFRLLRTERPVVTITNAYSPATLKLWWRSLFVHTPYVIWSGTLADPFHPESALRRLQRRLLTRRASAYIAYGSAARDYMVALGARPEAVHVAINTVDTQFFRERTAMLRAQGPAATGPVRFLYLGYLRPQKQIGLVMQAVAELARQRRDFVLDVVGEGDDRPALERFVREHQLGDIVCFHGYRQQAEIPAFLARSRCLLFQTGFDRWGLVLVEAMAAGLVCFASVNAGATRDLIRHGENGYAVDFADTAAVVRLMARVIDDAEGARAMGEAAREFIRERASLAVSAAGVVAAVQAVARAPARGGVSSQPPSRRSAA